MKSKPVFPRALASLDIDQAIAYHLAENAEQAAIGFIDVLEKPLPISGEIQQPARRDTLTNSTSQVCVIGHPPATRC